MSDLTYHLETENRNLKNYLVIQIVSASKQTLTKELLLVLATTMSERTALQSLIKEQARLQLKPSFDRFCIASERSFEVMKLLGTTGRVFYQAKKIVIDPFSVFNFYFKAERHDSDTAVVQGYWKLGERTGAMEECEWVMPGDPSWALKEGIVRPFHEDVLAKWIKDSLLGSKTFKGKELSQFISQTDGEIEVLWTLGNSSQKMEPIPFLVLTDRHGGFADLWFDYGAYGKQAFHQPHWEPWRNLQAELNWEKDLLETDFIKKIVDRSHYYCPLDRVAKSLTFILEMGWIIVDCRGRKVLRHKKTELDAVICDHHIVLRAQAHYEGHRVEVKDLLGVFNRRESFVELSPNAVALFDREDFGKDWGDFTTQEITSEGIRLKKNHVGLLHGLIELPHLQVHEDLKDKIAKISQCESSFYGEPGVGFQGTLFPYQKEGLQWLKFLEEGTFGGLLADEMGLGKTVQVLAFFSHLSMKQPCLVVVPTSLLFNWQREIEKFLPGFAVYAHYGKDRLRSKEELEQKEIILTSYALLRIDADILQTIDYQLIVLDEGQTIKNAESQVAEICFRLKSQTRLVITGTPIENRLEDLWSIFHFLQPDLLGEKRQFQAEIALSQMGSQYLEKMKRKIRPFILRRKKEQVALQLPLKLEQTVFVEMTDAQRTIYDSWLKKTKQGLLKKVSLDGAASHRMEILEAILRLRQLCAHPWLVEQEEEKEAEPISAKFERLMADMQEVVEEKRKVLVYSQFTKMLRLIKKAVEEKGWRYVYLDGSSTDREEAVRQFQENDEVCIFLISLKAGGVGLNLTAADYVFLYDPWWNDAVERQAIDRAHRLGRRETVIARRYINALSIEEKMMHLKEHKKALSTQLLENEEGLEQLSLDQLVELLKE